MQDWLHAARQWARSIKRDVLALWIAARDRRTPIAAKITAGAVAAYALSPIDLIPDFAPVLGYADDLLIVPLGIMLAVRLVPAPLMTEYSAQAAGLAARPVSRAGLVAIVVMWALTAVSLVWLIWPQARG